MVYATLVVTIGAVIVALAAAIWMYVAHAKISSLLKAASLFVVAVLVAVAFFYAWGRARKVSECAQNLKYIGAAVEAYYADRETYPPTLDDLMPFYFDDLPLCPLASDGAKNTYELGYESSADNFTVYCQGENHKGLGGASSGYPRYSAIYGLEL